MRLGLCEAIVILVVAYIVSLTVLLFSFSP
jgi:hypothetical protein